MRHGNCISAMIFDMDGVLVDTEPLYIEINNLMFARLGIEVPIEEHLRFVGISDKDMWRILRDRYRLKQSVDELTAIQKQEHFRRLQALHTLSPVDGVTVLLDKLKSTHIAVGLASSSTRKMVNCILKKASLSHYFDTTVSGDEITNGKPRPDIFFAAAKKLHTPPGRCCVIEDSPHGITAARGAEMHSIGFRNPNSGNQDLSGADLIVDDFSNKSISKILQFIGG